MTGMTLDFISTIDPFTSRNRRGCAKSSSSFIDYFIGTRLANTFSNVRTNSSPGFISTTTLITFTKIFSIISTTFENVIFFCDTDRITLIILTILIRISTITCSNIRRFSSGNGPRNTGVAFSRVSTTVIFALLDLSSNASSILVFINCIIKNPITITFSIGISISRCICSSSTGVAFISLINYVFNTVIDYCINTVFESISVLNDLFTTTVTGIILTSCTTSNSSRIAYGAFFGVVSIIKITVSDFFHTKFGRGTSIRIGN